MLLNSSLATSRGYAKHETLAGRRGPADRKEEAGESAQPPHIPLHNPMHNPLHNPPLFNAPADRASDCRC